MSVATSGPAYVPNPFYLSLTTTHASFALSHRLAHRFQPDVIPFAAVRENSPEAFGDLASLLSLSEQVYITEEAESTLSLTEDFQLVSTIPALQMRFNGSLPAYENDARVTPLTLADTDDMLALKARAFPGFFNRRAPELGSFFGIRDPQDGRLIAMGGERLATPLDREISALCTDPEHLGQGHAARILRAVLLHQARLGKGSILHVTAANTRGLSLYKHLGFETTCAVNFLKLRRR